MDRTVATLKQILCRNKARNSGYYLMNAGWKIFVASIDKKETLGFRACKRQIATLGSSKIVYILKKDPLHWVLVYSQKFAVTAQWILPTSMAKELDRHMSRTNEKTIITICLMRTKQDKIATTITDHPWPGYIVKSNYSASQFRLKGRYGIRIVFVHVAVVWYKWTYRSNSRQSRLQSHGIVSTVFLDIGKAF